MSFFGSTDVSEGGVGGELLTNNAQRSDAVPERTTFMKLNCVIYCLMSSGFLRSLDTKVEGTIKP